MSRPRMGGDQAVDGPCTRGGGGVPAFAAGGGVVAGVFPIGAREFGVGFGHFVPLRRPSQSPKCNSRKAGSCGRRWRPGIWHRRWQRRGSGQRTPARHPAADGHQAGRWRRDPTDRRAHRASRQRPFHAWGRGAPTRSGSHPWRQTALEHDRRPAITPTARSDWAARRWFRRPWASRKARASAFSGNDTPAHFVRDDNNRCRAGGNGGQQKRALGFEVVIGQQMV